MHRVLAGVLALNGSSTNYPLQPQGGEIYKISATPALQNITVHYKPPFDAAIYGGYYQWSVDNNTVGFYNNTNTTIDLLTIAGVTVDDNIVAQLDAGSVVYPYFLVQEGNAKHINTSAPYNATNTFDKILFINMENEVYNWTMSTLQWRTLATRGKLLTDFHAITHPSAANYVTQIAGDYFGLAGENFYNINATSIYDLLDTNGITHKVYAEFYNPSNTTRGINDCNNAPFQGPIDSTNPNWYSPMTRRVDIPQLFLTSYTSNYTRCSLIVNADDHFQSDVLNGKLPQFTYYSPSMTNNAHDPTPGYHYIDQPKSGGNWLLSFLDMYLPYLTQQKTLVVVGFDEATWTNDDDSNPNNNNHITGMLFGHGITPNTTYDNYITYYSALSAVEQNFGLGNLGRNDTNTTNGNLLHAIS